MWFYEISNYVILWNFWLCDSMKDSGYVCIWTCSIFMLPEKYWWIGCSGQRPSSGSFGDILFWFLWGHFDSGMGRTFDVHKGDFLGLETSIWRLMFYSVQGGSVCNSPILSGNIIYMGIPVKGLSAFCYVHSASAYVTY